MASRALTALPILLLTPLMIRACVSFGPPLPAIFQSMQKTGYYASGDVSVRLLDSFYRIPGLDDALAHITVAFAQVQMWPADEKAWWQSFTLVIEWAGVYTILMLEGSRKGNRGSVFQYPFLLAFFGQLIAIGSLSPLWFYASYLTRPLGKNRLATELDPARVRAVPQTILLAYLLPSVMNFLHPSYEARHWWNWVWQLYPVWGSLSHFIFSKATSTAKDTKSTLRFIMGALAVVMTVNFWYMRLYAPFSWTELFVPAWSAAGAVDDRFYLRALLQWDYACYTGAVLLWLAYSFGSLKGSGVCQTSWVVLFGGAVLIGLLGGFGTVIVLGWLVREEMLSNQTHGQKAKGS